MGVDIVLSLGMDEGDLNSRAERTWRQDVNERDASLGC